MAKLLISEFTEFITLLSTNNTVDAGGGVTVDTASSGNIFWAKIEQIQDSQNNNESTINDFKSYRATIRDNNTIAFKTSMVLKWNFRNYNITSIKSKAINKFEYKVIEFNEIYDG